MSQPAANQIEALQVRLRYRFGDLGHLHQALVHRSFLNEPQGAGRASNERLEFLGDAILGAVVAQRLYADFPDADEGWMTLARSRLVRKETLARIGRELGLGACLLMGAGNSNAGARNRDTVLSRALEAVFGAVWLDGGGAAAERIMLQLLADDLAAIADAGVGPDPKSELQQFVQSQRGEQPTYEIVDAQGPQHDPSFRAVVAVGGEPVAEGEGRSKRAAEMDAARQALRLMQRESA